MTIEISMTNSRKRVRRTMAAFVAACLVTAGCADSDAAEDVDTPSTVPDDQQLPAIDAGADDAVDPDHVPTTAVATDPGVDAIDAPEAATPALDDLLAAAVDPTTGTKVSDLDDVANELPETWTLNSRGEELRLDEAAQLACANNQFAWVDLQNQDTASAAEWLGVAAARAEQSLVAEINAAANSLAEAWSDPAAGAAAVDRFLDLCTARGFEV